MFYLQGSDPRRLQFSHLPSALHPLSRSSRTLHAEQGDDAVLRGTFGLADDTHVRTNLKLIW